MWEFKAVSLRERIILLLYMEDRKIRPYEIRNLLNHSWSSSINKMLKILMADKFIIKITTDSYPVYYEITKEGRKWVEANLITEKIESEPDDNSA